MFVTAQMVDSYYTIKEKVRERRGQKDINRIRDNDTVSHPRLPYSINLCECRLP